MCYGRKKNDILAQKSTRSLAISAGACLSWRRFIHGGHAVPRCTSLRRLLFNSKKNNSQCTNSHGPRQFISVGYIGLQARLDFSFATFIDAFSSVEKRHADFTTQVNLEFKALIVFVSMNYTFISAQNVHNSPLFVVLFHQSSTIIYY